MDLQLSIKVICVSSLLHKWSTNCSFSVAKATLHSQMSVRPSVRLSVLKTPQTAKIQSFHHNTMLTTMFTTITLMFILTTIPTIIINTNNTIIPTTILPSSFNHPSTTYNHHHLYAIFNHINISMIIGTIILPSSFHHTILHQSLNQPLTLSMTPM